MFQKFYNKTLLLNNIHFSLLNELNIEVVATSNLVPALMKRGFSAANFISDRTSVSAYIGPILSVIRISAKSYIGATLVDMSSQLVLLDIHSMTLVYCEIAVLMLSPAK